MKGRLIATVLVLLTALAPHATAATPETARPSVEMVFAIDTTGSMSGLIDGAKRRVWGIVNEIMRSRCRPTMRIGLVAYRDRGDAYVTQVLPLTTDLDSVYTTLMAYRADGGGDNPEDVRSALRDAVEKSGWSTPTPSLVQVIFLVGDAPPHDEYQDVPDLSETAARAAARGMVIHAIQCGSDETTARRWRETAVRAGGGFFSVPYDGAVAAIERTPYDAPLAELGKKLGGTYLAYGTESEQEEAGSRQADIERSVARTVPRSTAADRAVNKAINTTAYVGDLLQEIENGAVSLDDLPRERLPAALRDLSPEELRREVVRRLARRRHLRAAVLDISHLRDTFLASGRGDGDRDRESGFDRTVADAVGKQLARKGSDCR